MRADPLTPERLLELEALRAAYHTRPHDPYDSPEYGVMTVRAAYLLVLDYATPELLRVYRGASGDRSLSARMEREARIVTLEAEVGRLRELERLGLTWAGLVDILSRPMDLTPEEAEIAVKATYNASDALLTKLKERLRDG